jgi:hypothetical protein
VRIKSLLLELEELRAKQGLTFFFGMSPFQWQLAVGAFCFPTLHRTHTHTHNTRFPQKKKAFAPRNTKIALQGQQKTYRYYAVERVCKLREQQSAKEKKPIGTCQISRLKIELQEANMTISSLQLDVNKEKKVPFLPIH